MNKTAFTIIVTLILTNILTYLNFRETNKSKEDFPEMDELIAYKVNFLTVIKNGNVKLQDVTAKDSSNNVHPLQDNFKSNQNRLLVCRFSETNCESCVNHSIQMLLGWVDSIGKNNILFLGSYHNNKTFSHRKPQYGIDTLNVANAAVLNLPAEGLGYPYYFVLDSALNVLSVFVPDKGYPKISKWYLELVKERYFADREHF